ncbi:hypothetical protein F4703DRAFT_1766363 [Phycomyces blakesleeanus]
MPANEALTTPSPPTSPCDGTDSSVSTTPELNQTIPKSNPEDGRETKCSVLNHDAILSQILPSTNEFETKYTHVFHWNITDWRSLEPKSHSPVFHAGEFPWRILLFPKGNSQHDFTSVYLEVADPAANNLTPGWHVCAQFSLIISNPNDPTVYYHSNANHRFSAEEVDWGFTRFYDIKFLAKALNGKGPFVVNNQTTITVLLRIVNDPTGVLWHSFVNYDSRKETGYVGIKNQGATCYMNSLLQSLYCTNAFRKAVYQIPTENEEPTKSVALALQRCFYNLQNSNTPIGTTELTKSFGWDSLEAFMQHDVQEFNRVLQNNMEIKMKGTPADGAISNLFVGKMKSYIKCINVDYESSRVEDYYDIQLNVKGCKTLHDSFKDYVTVETLEGENKYMAEGHGLQDAHKGVVFESFPPVLHLQLKRFEYDFMRDTMVKINDRHEFPEEINLDEFCSISNPDEPFDYVLHGVLVHSGDLHAGHYFALIKPEKDGKWLKFDDDRVIPVTKKEVFDENFGEEAPKEIETPHYPSTPMRVNSTKLIKRFTNAYMLVYIRKNKLDEILAPVLEDDIPRHLKRRLSEEQAALEKRKKDREDMLLFTKVAVVTDSTFLTRQEFDLAAFDDRVFKTVGGVEVFKVPKNEKILTFKQQLAEHFKLDLDKIRLWSILFRSNKTVRVDQALSSTEERMTIEKLRETTCFNKQMGGFAKIYLETTDQHYPKLPTIKADTSIVFIKYFDIWEQKMRGLGHIFVKADEKVGEIIPSLIERAGLPKESAITLYEEIKPTMVEYIAVKQTFKQAEIQHGDIICFQMTVSDTEAKNIQARGECATVREYFSKIYHRTMVQFKPKVDKRGQEVNLIMDRRSTYTYVTRELAKAISADASRIRFTTASQGTGLPKDVLPYSPQLSLEAIAPMMLSATEYAHSVSLESLPVPTVYYEILDVSVADMETKKSVNIVLLGPTLRDESPITVLVPRNSTIKSLSEAMYQKSKTEKKDVGNLRVYEAVDGAITKEFSMDQPVGEITEKGSVLYAEQIPEDERTMDMDSDRLIQVVHYHKSPTALHGVPFRFVVKKGELFSDTKKRLQKRIGMSDKEWQKVKVTLIRDLKTPGYTMENIDKDDIVLRTSKFGDEDALGLDHIDKSSKSSRFGVPFERGIFIRG